MRASLLATELGLTLLFVARSFTRIYQRRAVALYGIVGARAARVPGSGVIPAWVSLMVLGGWALALIAGAWMFLQ
jgi:hypothetical protein